MDKPIPSKVDMFVHAPLLQSFVLPVCCRLLN